jgi:O-antigen ligase
VQSEILFLIADRMIVPFAVFLVAPFAFRTRHQREILVATMVVFGAYIGLTTLFETLGPRALVIPPGILDASIGYHIGRGRGPFLEGSVNGVAMYTVIAFAGVALVTWRGLWSRLFAIGVASVCALGLLFTLTRSVWVAAIVATAATMILTRELRRYLLPAAVVAFGSLSILFSALPGLALRAEERRGVESSVWERENVNAAALQMAWVRPLVGVGLGTFNQRNADYFPLLDDIPQVAERHLAIHNVFLRLLTESGLIGVTLFLASVVTPVGTALFRRGPPEARRWQTALLAVFLFWIVVANFAPIGQVFTSTIVWMLAGATLAACADVSPVARGTRP